MSRIKFDHVTPLLYASYIAAFTRKDRLQCSASLQVPKWFGTAVAYHSCEFRRVADTESRQRNSGTHHRMRESVVQPSVVAFSRLRLRMYGTLFHQT